MRNLIKTTAAAIVLSAVFAGPASAEVSARQLAFNISLSMSDASYISVHAEGGVVTLTGFYEDIEDQKAAIAMASKAEGVTKVIDLATAPIVKEPEDESNKSLFW